MKTSMIILHPQNVLNTRTVFDAISILNIQSYTTSLSVLLIIGTIHGNVASWDGSRDFAHALLLFSLGMAQIR
jgi:hypothetical protein